MHHIFPVFVEAKDGEEADEIAICLWAGCPRYCEGELWPPPRRMSWRRGIWWDYIVKEHQIMFPDEVLIRLGVSPSDLGHLKRCRSGDGFCLDFPLRVSDVGMSLARVIAIQAANWGVLLLAHRDEETGRLLIEEDLEDVLDILAKKPDNIWITYVDMHE